MHGHGGDALFASLVPFFPSPLAILHVSLFLFFPFWMRPVKFISGYRPCQPCTQQSERERDRVWREIRALYYQTPARIRKSTPSSHGASTLGAVFDWYSHHLPTVHDPARVVRRAKVHYAAASSQQRSICTLRTTQYRGACAVHWISNGCPSPVTTARVTLVQPKGFLKAWRAWAKNARTCLLPCLSTICPSNAKPTSFFARGLDGWCRVMFVSEVCSNIGTHISSL